MHTTTHIHTPGPILFTACFVPTKHRDFAEHCMYGFVSSSTDGLSLLNEDGGLRVFFPRNSIVTNSTLTHTNSPRQRSGAVGNDHIVCYGTSTLEQVTWHNSMDRLLMTCPTPCGDCGDRCQNNGAVGVDPQDNEHTDIHMYTNSPAYVNQDLECQVSSGQSAFIGVHLINGGEHGVIYYFIN